MADILHIDSVDMATLGLVTRKVTGHRDAPRKTWPRQSVPGRVDSVIMSSQPTWLPRTVDLFGTIKGASHTDLLTNIAALKAAIHTPAEVDLSFVDDLTVKLVARVERFEVTDVKPGFSSWIATVRITFVAHDPAYVAV